MFQEIGKTTAVAAKVTKAPWSTVQGIIYIYIYILYIYLFAELARGEETRGETKIVLTFSDRC